MTGCDFSGEVSYHRCALVADAALNVVPTGELYFVGKSLHFVPHLYDVSPIRLFRIHVRPPSAKLVNSPKDHRSDLTTSCGRTIGTSPLILHQGARALVPENCPLQYPGKDFPLARQK